MFYGEKLRMLRGLYGYSISELADAIDLHVDLLAQIEGNKIVPDFMVLQKLHKHLKVRPSYFFEAPYMSKFLETNRMSYRNQVDTFRAGVEQEQTFLNVFLTHLTELEKLVFPTQDFMIDFAEKIEKNYDLEKLMDADIRFIAKQARKELQIGTNQRLMYFLEVNGLYIVERNLANRAEAYSAWLLDGIYPVIVLNDEKKSIVHRNFYLVRELGHLLLHQWIDFDEVTQLEWAELERKAALFASYFLLSTEEFAEDFSELTDPTDPMEYIGMKIKYQVSILKMAKHGHTEGWLSDADFRKFCKQIRRLGYNNQEPLDQELVVHLPGKLRALLAKAEEIHPGLLNEWLNAYSVEVSYFERLFGIKDHMLREYLSERDEEKSVKENIIWLDEL